MNRQEMVERMAPNKFAQFERVFPNASSEEAMTMAMKAKSLGNALDSECLFLWALKLEGEGK